jgi:hypothetical protein
VTENLSPRQNKINLQALRYFSLRKDLLPQNQPLPKIYLYASAAYKKVDSVAYGLMFQAQTNCVVSSLFKNQVQCKPPPNPNSHRALPNILNERGKPNGRQHVCGEARSHPSPCVAGAA